MSIIKPGMLGEGHFCSVAIFSYLVRELMENWMHLDVVPVEKINPSFKGLSGQESQLPPTVLSPRPSPAEQGQGWDSEELLAGPAQGRLELGGKPGFA